MFVVGHKSKIVQELRSIYDIPIDACPKRFDTFDIKKCKDAVLLDKSRYLFCHATQISKRLNEQTPKEIENSLATAISTIAMCEHILENNPIARICIVGSADAEIRGCYDTVYCMGKVMVHWFVRTRKLTSPDQQLVCVAPSLLRDGGMVTCREDLDRVDERIPYLPKQEFITCKDVAKAIHFLLYEDNGHITNTILDMTGGIHAPMKGEICPL